MSPSDDRKSSATRSGEYVVVARRYRPQLFSELVGQGQVAQALGTAIATHRVGHAYLFTGARGVGKTSTARIFAKALNCVQGPKPEPCNQCDICQRVAGGDDLDVLEIDGASNRGIDEIRQLRSNISIRPSRARFKIYIIDEVHMLTPPAFNALLKTLEEPPEHVKFIFCTTEPEKIPITILSRCQRFDFPPVEARSIIDRLRHIVTEEGLTADDEALQLLARRANGSMRDSQSLLEQLLSSCPERITVADVNAMLGTARSGQLASLALQISAGNVSGAFQELDRALHDGVDAGQLAEQLIGYFRDMLAVTAGCGPEMLLHAMASDYTQLREMGARIGMESLLAMVQILDQSLSRMRYSGHVRTLLEIALARICRLDCLDDLSRLVAQLRQGGASTDGGTQSGTQPRGQSRLPASGDGASAEKKTAVTRGAAENEAAERTISRDTPGRRSSPAVMSSSHEVAPVTGDAPTVAPRVNGITGAPAVTAPAAPAEPAATNTLCEESVEAIWKEALANLGDMTADFARHAERIGLAGPNRLVAHFREAYSLHKEYCERTERRSKLEEALSRVVGHPVRLDVALIPDESPREARPTPVPSARQRLREKEQHPLVRRAMELFEAEVVRIDEPRAGSTGGSTAGDAR